LIADAAMGALRDMRGPRRVCKTPCSVRPSHVAKQQRAHVSQPVVLHDVDRKRGAFCA
jgi:hypothetical protein